MRVAQVAGEGALEVLKIGGRCGAHQAAWRIGWRHACRRAMRSTSAVTSSAKVGHVEIAFQAGRHIAADAA
jgi:hypothetical protein